MRLQGKTALITGRNSGIGLATAKLFVEEGASVAITERNQQTLDAALAELGGNTLAIRADVTDTDAIEAAAAEAAEKFGRIDILLANAGVGGSTPLGATSREQFDTIIESNLTGVFFTVQAALPYLSAGASVILVGSVHAKLGMAGWSAYAATKGALRSMGRVLASELAPKRIRVNIVSPGATRTPIWGNALPVVEQRTGLAVPLGRLSEPEEVAKAVLYLASDDAANVTAAEIMVDRGHTGAPAGAPVYRD